MRFRAIISGFLGFILICTTGCGNKKVDYKIDETDETNQTNVTIEAEDGDINQLLNSSWTEIISTKDEDGNAIDFNINLTPRILEEYNRNNSVNVYYFEYCKIDSDYKEKIARLVFKNSPVYKEVDNSLVQTNDFSGDIYYGNIDKIIYELQFDNGFRVIQSDKYNEGVKIEDEDAFELPEDEKIEIMNDYLAGIGISTKNAPIDYQMVILTNANGEAEALYQGYIGTQFVSTNKTYGDELNNYVEFILSGKRVVGLTVINPINIVSVQKDVRLASMESIKGHVKEAVKNNPQLLKIERNSNSKNEYSWKKMWFTYCKVSDDKGTNALIPAWLIQGNTYINALDGTIIK